MRFSPAGWPTVGRVLGYAVLVIWSAVILFPLYWLGVTSIKQTADIDGSPTYLPFVDFQPTLDS